MKLSKSTIKQKKSRVLLRILAGIGFTGFILLNSLCSKPEETVESRPESEMKPEKIIGIGRIEPEKRIVNLSSEIPGIVSKIMREPGTTVQKGEAIITQINAVEKARLAQAESRIMVQESQIEGAKAALDAARAKLKSTQNDYERLKKLFAKQAKPESQYEKAQADFNTLRAEINGLEANVTAARYMLVQYQADLKRAKAELAQKSIVAPEDGRILSIDIPVGTFISPGQVIGAFAPESPLAAWCEIDELFADLVEINQKAIIRYPGRTEKLADGTVIYVGPWLRKKSIFSDDIGDLEDRRVREARIRLTTGKGILPGSRIECVIFLGK